MVEKVSVLRKPFRAPSNYEECGGRGAEHYLRHTDKQICQVVNLDVCGMGNQIYIDELGTSLPAMLTTDCKLGHMPFNDGNVFSEDNIPTVTISSSEQNCSFQTGISKIWQTIHGNRLDNDLSIINFEMSNIIEEKVLTIIKSKGNE